MLGWVGNRPGDRSRVESVDRNFRKAAGEASLTAEKDGRTRVGVIGLGRLWETRHKPALARMSHRFEVTAVYDQVARRAAIEAGQLGCSACDGLSALIHRDDVDVIQILAPQWFGGHAVELACAAGKPIYCALPLAGDPDVLEALASLIESSGAVFMPELARRFYPATLRLRELLATKLGAPRLILGQSLSKGFDRYGKPGPSTQLSPAPLLVDPGAYLIDWCRHVFQDEPIAARGFSSRVNALEGDAADDPDFECFHLDFKAGQTAQISFGRHRQAPWGDPTRFMPPAGFQVFADRGAAWVEMPNHVVWADSEGVHDEILPQEPDVGEVLNDQFQRLVRGEASLAPGLKDLLAVSRLVKKLRAERLEKI